jgi:hypothetical protein
MTEDPGFAALRHGTCAVGYAKMPWAEFEADPKRDAVEISGTGFLVGPLRRLVTCAHVIEEVATLVRKRGARHAEPIVQFVLPASGGHTWTVTFRPMTVLEQHERADMAIVEVKNLPPEFRSLPVVDDDFTPSIGEEIGVVGYAHGSVLLRKGKEIARFGPVLQRGIISALSPYDVGKPDVALLDLVAGPAASGSPVFRVATGEVFGVLFEGQIRQSAALAFARLIGVNRNRQLVSRVGAVRFVEAAASAQESAQSDRIAE